MCSLCQSCQAASVTIILTTVQLAFPQWVSDVCSAIAAVKYGSGDRPAAKKSIAETRRPIERPATIGDFVEMRRPPAFEIRLKTSRFT